MNRAEELAALNALEIPSALEGTVERAKKRRAGRRLRLGIPLSSLAGAAAAFVILVNVSVPFALACGQIPILKDLVLAASGNESLKAALESDYYQILNQEYTKNGITLKLYCMVADAHQVNVFLSVSAGHGCLRGVSAADGGELGMSWSASLDDPGARPWEPQYFTVDFAGAAAPRSFTIRYDIYEDADWSWEDEPLASFRVPLTLNQTSLDSARAVELGTRFELDGQILTLERVILSPTHTQIDLSGQEGNTAWLTGLTFQLEDEQGNVYDTVHNGISSFGDPGDSSPFAAHYRIQSTYFSQAEHLTLRISSARWLDKDCPEMVLDTRTRTAENLPEYVKSWEAQREGTGWNFDFEVEETGGSFPFFDPSGYGNHTGTGYYQREGSTHTYLTLEDCDETCFRFPLYYNRATGEDTALPLF